MGLDGMRVGSGRCPPVFVGGLLLSCLLLVCNWWSLSTENLELLRQIDVLSDQLKISADERDQCVTLKENAHQRYNRLDDEVGTLHVRLQQMNEMKGQNEQLSESLTMCKSELESLNKVDATKSATLETLKVEKDDLANRLKAKEDESKQFKADLDAAMDEIKRLQVFAEAGPAKEETKTEYSQPQSQGVIPSVKLGHLPMVPVSSVIVNEPGKLGIKYHGIPILPKDSPGAVRQSPRFSVKLPKAPTSEPNKEKIVVDVDANKEEDNAAEADPSGLEKPFERPNEITIEKPHDEQH